VVRKEDEVSDMRTARVAGDVSVMNERRLDSLTGRWCGFEIECTGRDAKIGITIEGPKDGYLPADWFCKQVWIIYVLENGDKVLAEIESAEPIGEDDLHADLLESIPTSFVILTKPAIAFGESDHEFQPGIYLMTYTNQLRYLGPVDGAL